LSHFEGFITIFIMRFSPDLFWWNMNCTE
jgi:hypothetical protein